jgi:hypothetical protein
MARRRKQNPKQIKKMSPVQRLMRQMSYPGQIEPQGRHDLPGPSGLSHAGAAHVQGPGHQHLTFCEHAVMAFGTKYEAAIGKAGLVHPKDKRELTP